MAQESRAQTTIMYKIGVALVIISLLYYPLITYIALFAPEGETVIYPWWNRALHVLVLSPITTILGLFIMRRVPGNIVGPALIVFQVLGNTEIIFAMQQPVVQASLNVFWLSVAGVPSFIIILSHFPSGELHPRRVTPVVYVSIGVMVVLGFVLLFSAPYAYGTEFAYDEQRANPFAIEGLRSVGEVVADWGGILAALLMIASVILQAYRYRQTDAVERKQMRWLFFGMLITIMIIIINLASTVSLGDDHHLVVFTLNASIIGVDGVIPISIAAGILFYKLWDIDIVINRSLVYGVVTLVAVGIFFSIALTIQLVFGNQNILIAFVFSLIVSASVFNPLRNRIQHLVDRYIYGLRFDLNELRRAQQAKTITQSGKFTGLHFGDYEVRGVIGKGGMGEVYSAYGNGQEVAIKTMLPEIARDPELKTRFEREVEFGLSIKNPHIAEVYLSGEYDGTPYIVMEYIEGQDVDNLLKQQGQVDEKTAAQIVNDICLALSEAHKKGFVHRDIKPSNIMLRNNGSAVLMDFGISKMRDAKTITGTGAIGTIQYMAPEQIVSSKDVDHRADIYALGCLLYQLLTGSTPFTGGAAHVMFSQIQEPAPDPRSTNPDISDEFADVILKALEKDPDDRFASADEFSTALSN